MITEGEAAIPLETTRCAFRNQEKLKQRSAIEYTLISAGYSGNIDFFDPCLVVWNIFFKPKSGETSRKQSYLMKL